MFYFLLFACSVDLTRFGRVRCSTAERKRRPNTDFRSARCSKRINPPKITPLPQFLHTSKADMLKFPFSSLATQFHPKRVPYKAFVSPQLRFGKIRNRRIQISLDTFAVRIVCRVKISSLSGSPREFFCRGQNSALSRDPGSILVCLSTTGC